MFHIGTFLPARVLSDGQDWQVWDGLARPVDDLLLAAGVGLFDFVNELYRFPIRVRADASKPV